MNQEVGSALDLTPHAKQWSGMQLSAARNNREARQPADPGYFNLISHPWLFPTVAKLAILQKHFENVATINQTYWNLREVWPAVAQGRPLRDKFVLQVDRERIVDDLIAKLAQFDAVNCYWADPFKIPLVVKFNEEEGEDWGGLRKELFALLFQSLLSRAVKEELLHHNEDV